MVKGTIRTGTKTVYIDGNGYGYGNIGDDAILQGIISILRGVAGISKITIATNNGHRLPFLEKNIRISTSFDFDSAKRMIRESDCLIVGGGTMIGDELGIPYPLGYNTQRILYAKKNRKTNILFNIGINKPATIRGRELAGMMVRHADLITVRDSGSLEICRTFSRHPESLFQTADPAFLLEPAETERSKKIKERIRSRGPAIGINVINEVWARKTAYKKAIAVACDMFSQKYHYFPVFIPNEIRPGQFFDREANRETASYMNSESMLLEPEYLTPGEMIDIISAFDLFFSMRMHGLIFAAIAGVPFVTVSRIDKVENFMRMFNRRPAGTLNTVSSGHILADLETQLRHRNEVITHLQTLVSEKRRECLRSAVYLQECLDASEDRRTIGQSLNLWADILKYNAMMKI